MTALTLYGSNVAATTVTTACKLATTTGGTETSTETFAPNDNSQKYIEVWSQGGTVTDSASLPAPDGHGWLFDVTTLESQTIATGNWSATVALQDPGGALTSTLVMRFYKRSSGGTYTSIGSITQTGNTIGTTRTVLSLSATSMGSMAFVTGDKLYIDLFILPTGSSTWTADGINCYLSNSATAGVANDFVVVTPGYSKSRNLICDGYGGSF
jgi:hypothetical protein